MQVKVLEDSTNASVTSTVPGKAAASTGGGLTAESEEAQNMTVADFLRVKRDEEVSLAL